MRNFFVGISLLSVCISHAVNQDANNLLEQFKKFYDIASSDINTLVGSNETFEQYVHTALTTIASTAAGRNLMKNIIDIYTKQADISSKNLPLRNVIFPDNECFFLETELRQLITDEDAGLIEPRNKLLKKKIKFCLAPEMCYNEKNNTISVNIQSFSTIVIRRSGELVREIDRPIDVGIFHELLHCYHWLKDPVTVVKLRRYSALQTEDYQCPFIKGSELPFNIDQSWVTSVTTKAASNIRAIFPYLSTPDLLMGPYFSDLVPKLFVDIEELLTIRGKKKTMYSISENMYRYQRKIPLRFGHVVNLDFTRAVVFDKKLYDGYEELAQGG